MSLIFVGYVSHTRSKFIQIILVAKGRCAVYNPRHLTLQGNYPFTEITMAAKKKAADFEQSLNALEALVNKMEQGDLTLEESLQAFSTGIQLTRECQTRLAEAEQQVTLLLEQQGEITLTEFDASDDE